MNIINTSEKFYKHISLMVVRAVEDRLPYDAPAPPGKRRKIHKEIIAELTTISQVMTRTEMDRKPVSKLLKTRLTHEGDNWFLSFPGYLIENQEFIISKDNKDLLRTWLRSGFKPTSIVSWRSHYL